MPREFGYGYYSDLLRALSGVEEQHPFDVAPDVVGSIILEMDRPEFRFLSLQSFFITRNLARAAVAGQFSATGLVNRSSNSLVVVTGYQNPQGAAQSHLFVRNILPDATFEAGLTTEVPSNTIDAREMKVSAVEPTPAVREVTWASAAAIGGSVYGLVAAGQSYPLPGGVPTPIAILPPNSYLLALGTTVNTIASGIFFGYTRPLFRGNRA